MDSLRFAFFTRRWFALVLSLAAFVGLTANRAAAQSEWTPIDLGTLGGTSVDTSMALDVSNRGDVVGSSTINGQTHAFLWTMEGGIRDLGTLGGASSTARGINEARQVVGVSDLGAGQQHAFIWTSAAGMVDLGTLGGSSSDATAINNAGQVVGTSQVASGERHPFLWTAATGMIDLAPALGAAASPTGINDAGQVVGNRLTSDWPFFWSASGGLVPIDGAMDARGINSVGVVTGSHSHPVLREPHPYVWTVGGGLQTVGFGSRGADINDAGAVAANPYDPPNIAVVFVPAGYNPPFTPRIALPPLPGVPALIGSVANAISLAGAAGQAAAAPTGTRHAAFWCRPNAPSVSAATATPAVLAPPDGRYVTVSVDYDVMTSCLASFTSSLSVTGDE